MSLRLIKLHRSILEWEYKKEETDSNSLSLFCMGIKLRK